jgi:hypothetical protein
VERAVSLLRRAAITLDHGLNETELATIEQRFGFTFAPDHRELLAEVLPTGDRWVNWRSDAVESIASRLAWPTDGTIFDVRENGFWPRSWGPRPPDEGEAEALARTRMAAVPVLVPLYSHRFLPAAPAPPGSPVFSVYQTDVVYYGDDLADYIAHEFKVEEPSQGHHPKTRIDFWSDLAEGAEAEDL